MNDRGPIVFDPQVGEDVRRTLTRLAAGGRLPPFREPLSAPGPAGKNVATPAGWAIGLIGLVVGLSVVGTSVQWSLDIVIPVSLCGAAVGTGEYAELLAGVGETEAEADLTERVRDEAQAVIDQAQASARRALGAGDGESRPGTG